MEGVMSSFLAEYKLEEITFKASSRGGNHRAHENEVWFLKTSSGARPNRMNLSHNLTDQLCWSKGDRVQLYKVGNKMWALKPHKTGLITLNQDKDSSISPLYFTNANMCLNFDFDLFGTVFDAWIDEDTLFFKPKNK